MYLRKYSRISMSVLRELTNTSNISYGQGSAGQVQSGVKDVAGFKKFMDESEHRCVLLDGILFEDARLLEI